MVLQLCEITAGLVAYLEPSMLELYGGKCDLPDHYRVKDIHPFVCLEADQGTSIWTVLSSKYLERRLRIPTEMKIGHPHWIAKDNFLAHPTQVWYGSDWAFVESSVQELSLVQQRNHIHLDYIAQLAQICRMPSREQVLACRSMLTHIE